MPTNFSFRGAPASARVGNERPSPSVATQVSLKVSHELVGAASIRTSAAQSVMLNAMRKMYFREPPKTTFRS